ncbi:HNH endonuclease [Bacillus sp. V3B]|uniref:HNH endonuclease n=1 Tax=Bacillus sp. V3B TaxID=2804915 RepID=UPI00210A5EFD|nr:hypothetical protein [Bacillus sp. V3B]MCQ6275773.1 HNH endonuclease [Bacillus sp. V3B]
MKKQVMIVCSMCEKSTPRTSNGNQKYCPECRVIASNERKRKHYIKTYPNPYPTPKFTKCSVCDSHFSSTFNDVPYCNKHYLRMYANGTLEPTERKRNRFTINDGIVTMHTNKGEPFIIDEIDLDKISGSTWCFNRSGRYLVANRNKKIVRLHRMILDVDDPKLIVDHINGDTSDNRRCNLRITSNKNNVRNSRPSKNNSTNYPGVDKRPSGKYRARITVNRKEILLGTFDTLEEAIQVRKNAENKYFGDYAPSKGVLK